MAKTVVEELNEAKTQIAILQSEATASATVIAGLSAKLSDTKASLDASLSEVSGLKAQNATLTATVEDYKTTNVLKVDFEAKAKVAALPIAVAAAASGGIKALEPAPVIVDAAKSELTYEQQVGVKVAGGMSKSDAVRAAMKEFPAQYQAALKRGIKL